MAKTANDICRQALREIRVLGVGQDMAAEDFSHANEKLDQLYAELVGPPRSLALFWDTAAVPDGVATALSQTLAEDIGRPYGRAFDRQKRDEAMNRLLKLIAPDDRTRVRTEEPAKRAAFF